MRFPTANQAALLRTLASGGALVCADGRARARAEKSGSDGD